MPECGAGCRSGIFGGPLPPSYSMLINANMKAAALQPRRKKRSYRMGARAEAAAETARRILQAVLDLHVERFHDQIALEDVAERAGVTVQTVLRRFGSKDRLIAAAAKQATAEVERQRFAAPAGDLGGTVDNLLDHYDAQGPTALRLLAQEDRVPQLAAIADGGRRLHREWVRRAFQPFLERSANPARLEAQLVALTDVYVWKVLHIDQGLGREETRSALLDMLEAVLRKGD